MNISVQNFENKHIKSLTKNKSINQTQANFGQKTNTQRPASLALVDTNHNKAFVQKSNLSFKGDIPLPPKNHVLERRIASVLQILGKDDLILVGKDIKEAKGLLQKSVGAVKGATRKVFFIPDEKLDGALAIHENELGMKSVINLNHENLTLDSKSKLVFVKEGQSAFLTDFEDIITPNFRFNLVDSKETNLAEVRKSAVKEFDFSHKDEAAIKNLNSKHLELLAPEEDVAINGGRKIKFADIGGQDEAIAKIKKSILYPIKYPNAYKNQILNRGIILEGPPGTGKTLLAEALANEADAHFIGINGLEMESKWVGESEENWRKLFKDAKQNSPTILFIDEFDAVARKRGDSPGGGGKHDDKVVNQLLSLMSDVEKGKYGNTFIVVTTNKAELLDEAITRSGRFGEKITMKAPETLKDSRRIFDIHSRNKPLSESIDKDTFAQKLLDAKTTGADISHIVNEAHKNAFERLGINEKMENETLVDADLENIKLESEDLHKALDEFKKQNKTNPKEGRVLGFHRPLPPSEPKP